VDSYNYLTWEPVKFIDGLQEMEELHKLNSFKQGLLESFSEAVELTDERLSQLGFTSDKEYIQVQMLEGDVGSG
jgi:hypothetical protein